MRLDIQETKYKILSNDIPILIFGTGKFAQDLLKILLEKKFKVTGFLQTEPSAERVLNIPVYKVSEVEDISRYQVLIGIFNRDTPFGAIADQLPDSVDPFFPWEIYTQFEQDLGWRYWLSNPDAILNNRSKITEIYNILPDGRSRFCLEHICKFRLGNDLIYGNYKDIDEQYFNEITLRSFAFKSINYLDAGAYDGDSFRSLLSHVKVNNAYLFEPGKENYKALCKNISVMDERVMCFPLAVADEEKIISFNSTGGESSSIIDGGTDSIATVALDNMFSNTKLDLIKLDVEGAESIALKGLEKTIKKQRPILTMSLYHKPEDIFELPARVLDIDNNYNLYIRQHYFNSFDCVLYAVPKL